MNCKNKIVDLFLAFIFLTSCAADTALIFHGENAMKYAEELLAFGPRIPGFSASEAAGQYIKEELVKFNWKVEFQEFYYAGTKLQNIVAKNNDADPQILIGTHYDTRQYSDQERDPEPQKLPVPGANDGTSGTAVLMELARVLQNEEKTIWLVFFDGEDQGNIYNWDWSIGADYFAAQMVTYPQEVIIIDMIGDADLNIYKEERSDEILNEEIWNTAKSLGYSEVFINEYKYTMMDDHLPFIDLGITTSLLIDFDYPYWHTQEDTLDKISSESLEAVGRVLVRLFASR